MADESLEGWYTDPFELHEARWMSQGTPTHLVRDDGVEGNDPPPNEPFKVTPVGVSADSNGSCNPHDMRRADDAERDGPYDSKRATRRGWDVFDETSGQSVP